MSFPLGSGDGHDLRPTWVIARVENGERRNDAVELVVLARAIGADPAAIIARVASAVARDQGL